jgi:hypothetical protein
MRHCVNDYVKIGRKVHENMAKVAEEPRNWRVHPGPISSCEAIKLRTFVSEDEWNVIQDWDKNGV